MMLTGNLWFLLAGVHRWWYLLVNIRWLTSSFTLYYHYHLSQSTSTAGHRSPPRFSATIGAVLVIYMTRVTHPLIFFIGKTTFACQLVYYALGGFLIKYLKKFRNRLWFKNIISLLDCSSPEKWYVNMT